MAEKIGTDKSYELNFKYQFNNLARLDKNLVPDLIKIQEFLKENPTLLAVISIKSNYIGNEGMHMRVTDTQKQNVIKEFEKLNYKIDKIKILSLGNKYYKLGYNFPSNLDVQFYDKKDIIFSDENRIIGIYLSYFK